MANSDTLFSANGAYNPAEFMPFTALSRIVDFDKTNIVDDDYYSFLPVASDFVVLGVYVKELEKCTSGTLSVYKNDASTLLGAAVTVGGDALAHVHNSVAATSLSSSVYTTTVGAFVSAGDVLRLKASADMKKGKAKITVIGYFPDGDSTLNVATPVWRDDNNKTVSDVNSAAISNTSKGDAV